MLITNRTKSFESFEETVCSGRGVKKTSWQRCEKTDQQFQSSSPSMMSWITQAQTTLDYLLNLASACIALFKKEKKNEIHALYPILPEK